MPTADPLNAARELRGLIEAEADNVEEKCTLTEPVVDGLAKAGLFRLSTPEKFGGFEASPEQRATITQLLEAGWRGFPGVPLTLIAIAAVTSTMVSVLKELETVRPAVAVVSGLVTLLSALWLSAGFEQMQTPGSGPPVPLTGTILMTIGAIVVLTAGLYLWNHQRSRTSSQSSPGSMPRTIIPLEAAPTSAPIG